MLSLDCAFSCISPELQTPRPLITQIPVTWLHRALTEFGTKLLLTSMANNEVNHISRLIYYGPVRIILCCQFVGQPTYSKKCRLT